MSVLRKKRIDVVLAQSAVDEHGDPIPGKGHLSKNLSSWDLIGFGIGIVIGTGIFTLTGVEARENAGPAIVLSFLVAGLVSLLAALCYAELASAVPTAGSSYTYAYTTIGELFAWIIGWDLVLEFGLGAAVVARGWSAYLHGVFPALPPAFFGEDSVVNLGAVLIVLVLGAVAIRGVKESAWVTNTLVVIKISVVVFVIALGLFFVRADNLSPFVPPSSPMPTDELRGGLKAPVWQLITGVEPTTFGMAGVFFAAAVVFFAYSGFEAVANLGEETRNPRRDMPLGLLGTLLVCTVLYVGVSFVITGMLKYDKLSRGDAVAQVFREAGLGWAGVLIGLAAVAGLSSVILVDIVTMGRIGFALSRDGLLPTAFARVHETWRSPVLMTSITIVGVALLAAFIPLGALAEMVSIGTLFAFLIVSIAVPVLRATNPGMTRPFRTPFSPVLPALSAICCIGLMTNLAADTWLRFVVWLLLGLLVYGFYGYRHSLVGRRAAGEV